jgi:hypothetical protein
MGKRAGRANFKRHEGGRAGQEVGKGQPQKEHEVSGGPPGIEVGSEIGEGVRPRVRWLSELPRVMEETEEEQEILMAFFNLAGESLEADGGAAGWKTYTYTSAKDGGRERTPP